LTVVKVAAN